MAVDADTSGNLSSLDHDTVDEDDANPIAQDVDELAQRRRTTARLAMLALVIMAVVLAAFTGWLAFDVHKADQAEKERDLFLEVGKQVALNLTTIDHTQADQDVQRTIDSLTGSFGDDFQKRAPAFIDVVKRLQSISTGTITEAGAESQPGHRAQILVTVTVQTTRAGAAQQESRSWKMVIAVEKVGSEAKVSNVEFVP